MWGICQMPHMPYVHKVNSATELRDMHKCTNSYLT